jgi:hypothetical protein
VRILVRPELLETVAGQLQQASADLRVLVTRLSGALYSLDWQSRHRMAVEQQVAAAGSQAQSLAGQAGQLGGWLHAKATAFAQADQAGAASLTQVDGAFQVLLRDALLARKRAWWEASLRGDRAGMEAAHRQAEHLRSLGASVTDEENERINAEYGPRMGIVQAKRDWWQAWIANDQAGMAKAHRAAEALRTRGAADPDETANAAVLNGALASVKHQWWSARLAGDAARMKDLETKADHLRSQGAFVSDAENQEINRQYEAEWERKLANQHSDSGITGSLRYSGSSPAPETVNENAAWPVDPPLSSTAGDRSRALYDDVINQFAVAANKRYRVRDLNKDGYDDTFCNIFVWDVTRAMGAEIPHWVDERGNGVAPGKGTELNANGVVWWLGTHGGRHGWVEASAEEAQARANRGEPAVAAWHSGSGAPGHVAIVRPGSYDPANGPTIAQSGAKNFNLGTVEQGFGSTPRGAIKYYVHP